MGPPRVRSTALASTMLRASGNGRATCPPRSFLWDRGSVNGRRLNQVDEVAAGVLKQDGGEWPHALWFTAEVDTTLLETPVLRGDVIRYESSGWNTGGKQCCLIRLSRRKAYRLQHELDAFRTLRRGHGQPTERTHGYVLIFHEAQHGRVEAESGLLVVNHYAGQPDLHRKSCLMWFNAVAADEQHPNIGARCV